MKKLLTTLSFLLIVLTSCLSQTSLVLTVSGRDTSAFVPVAIERTVNAAYDVKRGYKILLQNFEQENNALRYSLSQKDTALISADEKACIQEQKFEKCNNQVNSDTRYFKKMNRELLAVKVVAGIALLADVVLYVAWATK